MINLVDPATLTSDASNGPESWSEAFGEFSTSVEESARLIENTNSDQSALEDIYRRRIEKISALTGETLKNPVSEAHYAMNRRVIPSMIGSPITAQLQRQDYRQWEETFETEAELLRERFPGMAGIMSESADDQLNRERREAEARVRQAGQSPELGVGGKFAAGLVGGLIGSANDPFQWQMAMVGAGSSGAKTVAGRIGQTMMTEALINGGQEAVLQAASQNRKAAAGLEHGLNDALGNIGVAATFGALFGGAVEGASEVWRIYRARKPAVAAAVSDEVGIAATARVMEGRPDPGDLEIVAEALGVEIPPDRLAMINRSFEERTLDDVMIRPDASENEMRVFEAAQRYAEDPDNNPPPELLERMLADQEAASMRFTPDDYEKMFSGDENAVDDIADTFFAETIDDATRRVDQVADRVDAIAEQVQPRIPTMADGRTLEIGGGSLPERGLVVVNVNSDGRVYIGDAGDVHFSVADRYAADEFGAPEFTGFINPDGRIMDRAEAFRWVSENEKPVRPTEAMGETLDALDYREQVPASSRRAAASDRAAARPVAADQRAVANSVSQPDPLEGQSLRPEKVAEPSDDAAIVIAEEQAGDIIEPPRDANGNPENYLDFIAVEDGDGNVSIMSTAEALQMAEEPELFADLLASCKL